MLYAKKAIKACCPVCNCREGSLLWTVKASDAATHFLSAKKDNTRYQKLCHHIEKLWNKDSCDVIECSNCKFIYSYPYVAGDKLFYDLAYERGGYPKWKWEFQEALDIITTDKISKPRVLEIGAGNGAFIKRLIETATDAENIIAIEYSDYGIKQIEKKGVLCFPKNIRNLTRAELGAKFDYICLFQVLEHLDDLNHLLKILSVNLNNGGKIIFAVPNEKRIEFNELNGALLDMPPNHIGRWTRSAVQHYSESNNFLLIEHKYQPASFHSSALEFLRYRLMKASQDTRTISHSLSYTDRKLLKYFGLRILIILDALFNLNKLVNLAININKIGGGSQFFVLKKVC